MIPLTFKYANYISYRLAHVLTETTEGYINADGEWVLILSYLCCFPFSEGLAIVWLEGAEFNEGYIDITGAEVIPTHFADTSAFSEGYAYVKTKDGEHVLLIKPVRWFLN